MTGVGRLVLESLRTAVAELLPARAGVYEDRLAQGAAGSMALELASFTDVAGLLRREGAVSGRVTARAGYYAALASFASMSGVRRYLVGALPRRIRVRTAFHIIARRLFAESGVRRVEVSQHGSTFFVELLDSPFCAAGRRTDDPPCRFYANGLVTFLRLLNICAAARTSRCRSTGAKSCLLLVQTDGVRALENVSGAPVERLSELSHGMTGVEPVSVVPATSADPEAPWHRL